MLHRKKILEYLFEGGIQGKFFVERTTYEQDKKETHVYQVLGEEGIDQTIPAQLKIRICYLNNRYGNTPDTRTRVKWLGQLLNDQEATAEEIALAQSSSP
jgi:hypothetical protein